MQSQSGALGIAILERSARIGLGVSSFVSVGNKADVSGNDLLQYWEDDPGTDVVLLYLESFGNPRKFARIARRVSRRKPIVAVKSGRSAAGVRAASSHTAAMASPDIAVDALFRQAGVIRVDTLDELFDMALVLGSQPLPRGHRVAIVGNSGGPGILATDACDGAGLEVPELSAATQAALRAVVDPNAAVSNPVDLVASATPEVYEQALGIVLADDAVDAAIVICTPTFAAPPPRIADVLRRSSAATRQAAARLLPGLARPPTAAPWRTRRTRRRRRARLRVARAGRPGPGPRRELRHLAARPPGAVPDLDGFDPDRARAARRRVPHPLAGGRLAAGRTTSTSCSPRPACAPSPAPRSATPRRPRVPPPQLGFPVALKAAGPELVHKSDVGRRSPRSALRGRGRRRLPVHGRPHRRTDDRRDRPTDGGARRGDHRRGGPPPAVRAARDVRHGRDRHRVARRPVLPHPARHRPRCRRVGPLAAGLTAAVRLPRLAARRGGRASRTCSSGSPGWPVHVPALAELDINPLIVSPEGAIAVDARAKVAPVDAGPAPDLRQMS